MKAHVSRVLVVADRPVPSPALNDAVRRRARAGLCEFTLLVPAVAHGLHRVVDPEDQCCEEAQMTIERLLPGLARAANAPVASAIGAHEVLAAVEDAVNGGDVDEVILLTPPSRVTRWLHMDLPRKISALGVAVTAVAAPTAARAA